MKTIQMVLDDLAQAGSSESSIPIWQDAKATSLRFQAGV